MAKKQTVQELVVGQIIAFLGCVVFPGFVTAIAPVSWIRFHRDDSGVHANVKTCAFFFIPFYNKSVDQVIAIGNHVVRGTVERRSSSNSRTRSENEGFLEIITENGNTSVSVSPASLKSINSRAEAFVNDSTQKELRLFTVANWKFGIFAAGTLCLLTVLYVVGVCLAFLKYLRIVFLPPAPQ